LIEDDLFADGFLAAINGLPELVPSSNVEASWFGDCGGLSDNREAVCSDIGDVGSLNSASHLSNSFVDNGPSPFIVVSGLSSRSASANDRGADGPVGCNKISSTAVQVADIVAESSISSGTSSVNDTTSASVDKSSTVPLFPIDCGVQTDRNMVTTLA
jgi:hypothetical protein